MGKPTLFVPSPNVAEDHQTKNAQALVDRQAAVLVADAEAPARAMETAGELLADPARRTLLARNIAALAVPAAAGRTRAVIIRPDKIFVADFIQKISILCIYAIVHPL